MDLDIHFFTIVLNGMPFIKYHFDTFSQIKKNWHWHIIEGPARLVKDTSWSVRNGGKLPKWAYIGGVSTDGTTEYINSLSKLFPENVTVYRTEDGRPWAGKTEMVNAPLENIKEDCLLWQVDSDELWNIEDIVKLSGKLEESDKNCALVQCIFFVGPNKVVTSTGTWGNRDTEWLRVWKYKSGMRWIKHEPPVLSGIELNPLTYKDNPSFFHYAYVTEDQIRFKEEYYGYKGLLENWKKLNETKGEQQLERFFPFAKGAVVNDYEL